VVGMAVIAWSGTSGRCEARLGQRGSLGVAWYRWALRSVAWQSGRGFAWPVVVRPGWAVTAWIGVAWPVVVRRCPAGEGNAWSGLARRGPFGLAVSACHCPARCGSSRPGSRCMVRSRWSRPGLASRGSHGRFWTGRARLGRAVSAWRRVGSESGQGLASCSKAGQSLCGVAPPGASWMGTAGQGSHRVVQQGELRSGRAVQASLGLVRMVRHGSFGFAPRGSR
jgi:hypothetical protein